VALIIAVFQRTESKQDRSLSDNNVERQVWWTVQVALEPNENNISYMHDKQQQMIPAYTNEMHYYYVQMCNIVYSVVMFLIINN